MLSYHDREWGVPSHDERHMFEMLVLEGAEAGLSWQTILRKRQGYRRAFAGFDVGRVARFGRNDVDRLLRDPGIVRNRKKVEAAIANARAILQLRRDGTTFDDHLWSFVGGRPLRGARPRPADIPSETEESRAISRDLKGRGFRFVGPTVCYAFMQAVGMANDHETTCFRYRRV